MSDPADTGTPAQAPRAGGLARLLLEGALLLAAVSATVFAVAVLVPDVNDYALSSNLKHKVLDEDVPRKIVLVGGSNLAYGVDSTLIQEATNCPVTNMGMNGYFGVRFMLEEIKPSLKRGDIVVIAFEFDNFYKSVDGTPTDLLAVTKANPKALSYLTAGQILDVVKRYPYVAQQKALRVGNEFLARALRALRAMVSRKAQADAVKLGKAGVDLNEVETLRGFNSRGDLVSHLDKTWRGRLENGVDMTALPVDPEVIPLLQAFAQDMAARDVAVLVSYTPTVRWYHARHREALSALDARLRSTAGLRVGRPPSGFVFDPEYHFDTVYHLNVRGRPIRSARLVEDLMTTYPGRARCDSPARQTGDAKNG